ncbi:hypothetical protein [Thermoactinospora rubra]|uniref:hypothetical protein n=1 Tax=Thermoactinospora rubra TaxID=1088767 RepID=UPI000A11EA1E|nr:hypothetical protein [Thermoactinospora rubra]
MSFDELARDIPPGATAQAAGLVVGYGGGAARAVAFRAGGVRLRCASLLKPLYAWAADRNDTWQHDAEPAVVESSNTTTLRLWLGTGPRVILSRLAERTGVAWAPPPTDPAWFGSVEVSAEEVTRAYSALALAGFFGDRDALTILQWMVRAGQDFGVRTVFPGKVAVKCGWFGGADEACLRTHAVTVDRHPDGRVRVICAMTALPYPDEEQRARYRAAVAADESVEAEHERVAGALLRSLAAATLAELGGAREPGQAPGAPG